MTHRRGPTQGPRLVRVIVPLFMISLSGWMYRVPGNEVSDVVLILVLAVGFVLDRVSHHASWYVLRDLL